MGLVLLQEETGAAGENLRCLEESNWTTPFSHVRNCAYANSKEKPSDIEKSRTHLEN